MKKLWIYYALILSPLILLFFFGKDYLNTIGFSIALLVYALIYRPITDAARLKAVRDFERAVSWKLYIPFYGHLFFFKELYLN